MFCSRDCNIDNILSQKKIMCFVYIQFTQWSHKLNMVSVVALFFASAFNQNLFFVHVQKYNSPFILLLDVMRKRFLFCCLLRTRKLCSACLKLMLNMARFHILLRQKEEKKNKQQNWVYLEKWKKNCQNYLFFVGASVCSLECLRMWKTRNKNSQKSFSRLSLQP